MDIVLPDLAATRTLVAGFDDPTDERAMASRQHILALLDETAAPCSRDQFQPGHLTASAICLSPDRRSVLLVHHKRLQRWLQPGGHIEIGDASMLDAARRELDEETGATLDQRVQAQLAGVDVHEIPAARGEPTHAHHDVMFCMVAANLEVRVSEESHDVAWIPIDELDAHQGDAPLCANVRRALALLAL